MESNDLTTDPQQPQTYISIKHHEGYSQPVWQFVLLSILTFGIYDIYWYYRNWKYLKEYKGLDIKPDWRTIGLFVPIVNLFLIYGAHKAYRDLIREEGINREIYPGLIVVVIIIAYLLTKLPDPYWLLTLLGTVPLAIVQGILNELWWKVQPDRIHRTKLRPRQIVLIVIGSIIWILAILGMIFPQ